MVRVCRLPQSGKHLRRFPRTRTSRTSSSTSASTNSATGPSQWPRRDSNPHAVSGTSLYIRMFVCFCRWVRVSCFVIRNRLTLSTLHSRAHTSRRSGETFWCSIRLSYGPGNCHRPGRIRTSNRQNNSSLYALAVGCGPACSLHRLVVATELWGKKTNARTSRMSGFF